MQAAGLRVMFYPFVMLDVPPGNGLPDPYGAAEQAPFPWRGRVTCHPAPGRPGSPDKTGAAASQVAAFFAQYTQMVLHYAGLCASAGGVDAFIVGSELVGSHAGPVRPGHRTVPGGPGAEDAGCAGQGRGRAGLQGRLRGRLDRVPFAPPGRRHA